ncbi:MAG: DUF350 domain-containing protein [Thalassolituus sp.]|jgi:uncharacterized membrane protein YjfL (UPF0719 family)
MIFDQYGIYLSYAILCFLLMVILKYLLNFRAINVYSAETELAGGNIAVGLRRSGAQLGLAIALLGALSGSSAETLASDLLLTAGYGVLAIGFILSTLYITDRIVLPGVSNLDELKNNNIAVGIVEFGMLVATGVIAYASIIGEQGGVLSSVIHFAAGQTILVLLTLIFEKVVTRKVAFIPAIAAGEIASGIYLSGKLIAYSLILKSAIIGETQAASSSDKAIEFATFALVGMLFLYVFELLLDKFIITSSTVTDILSENKVVLSLQLSSCKVGIALILSAGIL